MNNVTQKQLTVTTQRDSKGNLAINLDGIEDMSIEEMREIQVTIGHYAFSQAMLISQEIMLLKTSNNTKGNKSYV